MYAYMTVCFDSFVNQSVPVQAKQIYESLSAFRLSEDSLFSNEGNVS